MNTRPKTGQEWEQHLANERDWYCPEHGYVTCGRKIHGGRGNARKCGREDCTHTVKSTNVDWEAYQRAFRNNDYPPCPSCGSDAIVTRPVKPKYVCEDCNHDFGTGAAYY